LFENEDSAVRKLARVALPESVKARIRIYRVRSNRKKTGTGMVSGHMDSSGEWRAKTRISNTVYFYHPERIRIGDNVFVWHFTILDGTGGLDIGEGCQIGAWVGLFTHSSHVAIRLYGRHYQEINENDKKGFTISPVKIGKYVFVGAGSLILPGVEIGDGSIVSAGSLVKHDVNPYEIVSGNPAMVIGDTRELDSKYLEDEQLKRWYDEWQDT